MQYLRLGLLAFFLVMFVGCTEMRIEGDAKVFQSSAVGMLISIAIGLGLMGLGTIACIASVWPDKKPKNRYAQPTERLSVGQRIGLAMFGFAMGFVGLFLTGISLVFPNKLHVTVYPDRVSMASTYSQTGGREVLIPFANLAKVEIRNELNIVGKLRPYIVFTPKTGSLIKQEAGNNERQALGAIQQALAEYQIKFPSIAAESSPPVTPISPTPSSDAPPAASTLPFAQPANTPPSYAPPSYTPPSLTPPTFKSPTNPSQPGNQQYSLKRYPIHIALPPSYSLVSADAVVADGTKLQACYANSWSPVTAVTSNEDGTITCSWDDYPGFTYRMLREDLITYDGTNPTQKNLSPTNPTPPGPNAPTPSAKQYTLKRYPINIAVPNGKSVVKATSNIQVGMKLGACYAGRWEAVTVVEVNADGTITCNWDNWKSFTYKMMREDLIIDKR